VNAWFEPTSWNLALFTAVICGALLVSIRRAVRGRPPQVRPLPALEALGEVLGRAVELGRPVLFVPGTRDLDNVQTVAGLALLGAVAGQAARLECALTVPTGRSLVMAAARDTCRAAYLAAGRADAWRDDAVSYVTDDQIALAARVDGLVARERPAACLLFGFFGAESLLFAEAGSSVGALQVAGTAEPSQIPFFVAACDHTLIGEDLFAASASLTGDPALRGTLRGQDLCKALVAAGLVAGAALATAAAVTGWAPLRALHAALLRLFEPGVG
jgi:hypothetical protein